MSNQQHPMIYVGPTFKNKRLNQYMIFRYGIPNEEGMDPVLKHLFVPPEQVNNAMVEIHRKGSLLHTFYQQALQM